MLLRRLLLENYGLFAGRHEFDLTPRVKYGQQRTIILFGGKNGAGKTTLLEALRVVLYGRLALGSRVRQVDYSAFLRGRIHRGSGPLVKPSSAMLAVEFDHVHRGNPDRYFVERTWRPTGSGDVVEELSVRKNDKRLEEVDAEFWQGFVRDIIPEGLAQLFFFDGEKIRELAEDATGTGVLAESIKALLGLDFVERLDADLTVYSNREVSRVGSVEDREHAAKCEAEIVTLREGVSQTQEELASIRTRTEGVHAEIRRAEEGLRREGEDHARRRAKLQEEATQLRVKIDGAERALREECDGLFPLALCPRIAKLLRDQMTAERSLSHLAPVKAALGRVRGDVLKTIGSRDLRRAGVTANAVTALRANMESVFATRLAEFSSPAGVKPLHHLSDIDYRRVAEWLRAAKSASGKNVTKLCEDLSRCKRRLDTIERGLAQVPSDDVVAPRMQALTGIHQRLGALEQSRKEIEERSKRFTLDLEIRVRELRKLAERYQDEVDARNRIGLARAVQGVLSDYLQRLTDLKVCQLRDAVAECFNRLCRKTDVVKSIDIDARTFAVTLFDRSGTAIRKEELSSGEKQIFAIAMLWGLARTSGRPLPVIIDTPLGRLDSDHRRKLIHEYFPNASHQVVLLSTDTEVDQALFADLGPSISHSYHLDYEHEGSCTKVSEGYFWRKKEEELCLT